MSLGSFSVGDVVMLLSNGDLVTDSEGNPLLYQVVAVYKKTNEASLVNPYGEYVGKFYIDNLIYLNSQSLFTSENYDIGQRVEWVGHEGIYEGTIIQLYKNQVKVGNVKKLYPIGYTKLVPYYKISDEVSSENTPENINKRDDSGIKGRDSDV